MQYDGFLGGVEVLLRSIAYLLDRSIFLQFLFLVLVYLMGYLHATTFGGHNHD